MKNNVYQPQLEATRIPNTGKVGYFNVCAITHDGSPVYFQEWSDDGDPSSTVERVLTLHKRGLDKDDDWSSPIGHVFITNQGKTYHFDLSDSFQLALFRGTVKAEVVS